MFRSLRLSIACLLACGLVGCAPEAKAPTAGQPLRPVTTASTTPNARAVQEEPLPSVAHQPSVKPTPAALPPPQRQAAPASQPVPEPKRDVDQVRPPSLPDAAIVAMIIRASLASYPGNCPCPYNSDRAGRQCGGRSAYSRPGGRAPLCYPHDVTPAMIEAERQKPRTSSSR